MPHLIGDRYLQIDDERACDLATGTEVRIDALTPVVPARVDADIAPIVEALDHGRDGWPRWVVAAPCGGAAAPSVIARIAAAATTRGFVAMSVESYLRLRDDLAADLQDRTLLLTPVPGLDPQRAHAALLDAAARSARPHVLITWAGGVSEAGQGKAGESGGAGRAGEAGGAGRAGESGGAGRASESGGAGRASGAGRVREARAAYAGWRKPRTLAEDPVVGVLLAQVSKAAVVARCGRHAEADRMLSEAACGLARRGEFARAARAAIERGRLLGDRGRVNRADAVFAEAARLATAAPDEDVAVEARIWQALGRISMASFVEAESLCRAVLTRDPPARGLRAWARAVLAETLCWQGRVDEASPFECPSTDDDLIAPHHAAMIHASGVRTLLAEGRFFDAGQQATRLKQLAASYDCPLVRVIAHSADLGILAATGDVVRVEETLRVTTAAARAARTPLRGAWVTLTTIDALERAGREDDAARLLRSLRHLDRIAPPLLRREIRRRAVGEREGSVLVPVPVRDRVAGCFSVSLIQAASEGDDDGAVLKVLLERLSVALHTSRIDLVSGDAGAVSTTHAVGEGHSTALGARALEAAFSIGPEQVGGGREIGVPVRRGSRVLGAIACRWPLDSPIPVEAGEAIELTAAVAAPRLEALLAAVREEARTSIAVPELIGESHAIASVRRAIVRAAAAPFGVLIEGESGVGKELAARALHQLGARRDRPFCDLNCAALPDDLLESELFGHARGAFSGAVADREGLFEAADGGTLFLDEVADLSPRAQAKLLRVIQQQEVRRVGESFSRVVDVRLVAAANRDMRAHATAGHFRHDLLYRLDVIRIRIPPLRERPDDVPGLAARFWRVAATRVGTRAELSPGVFAELSRYHWPGNVRELQNVISALAVAAPTQGRVRTALLSPVIGAATSVSSGRLAEARQQFERRFIEVALARASGSRTAAARSLGLSRQGLLKTMARLGLCEPSATTGRAEAHVPRRVTRPAQPLC